MNKIILFLALCVVSVAYCRPAKVKDVNDGDRIPSQSELEHEEAIAAKYHFASEIQDGISDLSIQREEKRDGLKVSGYYSYSDGHLKRKVSYEADENGYRVVGEEVEPLEGPQVNPEGLASIHAVAHGNEVSYSVEGDDKTRHAKAAAQ